MVEDFGRANSRDVLRYLVSELNRLFFQLWNLAQFGIGGAVLWLVWGVPRASRLRGLLLGMLAVVVFLTVWVTPEILTVGRNLDFVARDPEPPTLRRFGMLHATYTILELLKCGVGILAAVWIVGLGRLPADRGSQVESAIDATLAEAKSEQSVSGVNSQEHEARPGRGTQGVLRGVRGQRLVRERES